jgi:MFS family permease
MLNLKKYQAYWVVFSAALFFLFEFINMNSFNALNDQLREYFQVNALQISNLSAMYFYANVIFLIPAGLLLDRISTKKLLQGALFLCILSNFIFANTTHFGVAELCRFVTGMGSTLCLLSCALLTARWFEPRRAGLVMGLVVTMAMLGGMLAQQITFLANHFNSWRIAVMIVAALGLVFLIIISLLVQDHPQDCPHSLAKNSFLIRGHFVKNTLLTLKNKQIWFGGLYTSLINLTVMVIGALWGKDYLMSVQGLSAEQASLVISTVFFGLIVGSPLLGWISDRLACRKAPMIIGGVLNLIWISLIISLHWSYPGLIVAFFVLGVFSSSQIIAYPLIMESSPPHLIASSEALSATLIMGGGAVFQPLFGWLLDHYAPDHIYSAHAYQHAILVLPICFLIASILACLIKETYCQRP